MIFYYARGRLGNQIFQYLFLRKISKQNELLLTSGLEELFNLFDIKDRITNLNKENFVIKLLVYLMRSLFYFLSLIRLITSYKVRYEIIEVNGQKYKRESTDVIEKRGLLKNVKYVYQFYFQSEVFFDAETANQLQIKSEYVEAAIKFLDPYKDKYKVFVHYRLGDYKRFRIYGKSVLLPIDYYKKLINWFLENKENVVFIFLSDEPDLVEQEFRDVTNKVISYNSMYVDFAIMTLCDAGILSPSSFSWWGSYFMKNRDIVFAPKYWLGFESGIDFPKSTLADFMVAVEVKN